MGEGGRGGGAPGGDRLPFPRELGRSHSLAGGWTRIIAQAEDHPELSDESQMKVGALTAWRNHGEVDRPRNEKQNAQEHELQQVHLGYRDKNTVQGCAPSNLRSRSASASGSISSSAARLLNRLRQLFRNVRIHPTKDNLDSLLDLTKLDNAVPVRIPCKSS